MDLVTSEVELKTVPGTRHYNVVMEKHQEHAEASGKGAFLSYFLKYLNPLPIFSCHILPLPLVIFLSLPVTFVPFREPEK